MNNTKAQILSDQVRHIDFTGFDAVPLIESWRDMSFTARDAARAADIYDMMLDDEDCTVILTLAGSTSAGGCLNVWRQMIENNMVDVVVATGASIVDMDFFEALGFNHYKCNEEYDDRFLRENYINRIYDTLIDEIELQKCDHTTYEIANTMKPGAYSSRHFIKEMGRWLAAGNAVKPSLIQSAYERNVPIFVPAFSDCSAGFGLVKHQVEKIAEGKPYVGIDSVADFRELTQVKMEAGDTGLLMVGGGVPKNFAQDTVVCAEILGKEVPMHKYAVQITVADVRDGACSSSTLKEACSWGKVDVKLEQMVFAEAGTIIPLIASNSYHRGTWKKRSGKAWGKLFD